LDTIAKFPIDSVDEDGKLVWGTPKRFPTPIQLTPNNPDHVNLLRFAANILAMNLGSKKEYSQQDIINFMEGNSQGMFAFVKKSFYSFSHREFHRIQTTLKTMSHILTNSKPKFPVNFPPKQRSLFRIYRWRASSRRNNICRI